jgi:hypothetical protein
LVASRRNPQRSGSGAAKNSVIVFVDRIFTTFIQPPFTNVFDTIAPIAVTTCLYPVRNAD